MSEERSRLTKSALRAWAIAGYTLAVCIGLLLAVRVWAIVESAKDIAAHAKTEITRLTDVAVDAVRAVPDRAREIAEDAENNAIGVLRDALTGGKDTSDE